MIKLHLGCGPVYLDGYINIDIKIDDYTWLKEERPDILDYNRTTLDKYYKYDYYKRKHNLAVVDEFMDITEIPYNYNNVDEILIINTFEHFNRYESVKLLEEWYRLLKKGGKLIIGGIPDLEGTIDLLKREENEEWVISLIYGSQKNNFAYHKWGYTFEYLKDICLEIGFRNIKQISIIEHAYPTFNIEMTK